MSNETGMESITYSGQRMIIDWHRIEMTLLGVFTSVGAFFHESIETYLAIMLHWWPSSADVAKIFGFLTAIAVIWMNVESALTKRAERRKLNRKR